MTKGEALQEWRKRHGLTQEAAARLAGSSLSGWRTWERNGSSGPSVRVLKRLEAAHPGIVDAVMGGAP